MIQKQHLGKKQKILYFFYIKVYYIMDSQLQLWRNSFRLVPDASAPDQCKKGQTFRSTARHSSVEFGETSNNCPSLGGASLSGMTKTGTAKPGPTTQFDSSLARRRKIQVRTKSNKTGNSNSASTNKFERTFRGYNSHVENGRDGYTNGKRAQLFGHENRNANVPAAGVRGDASDVIYFRPIFEKFKLDVTSK